MVAQLASAAEWWQEGERFAEHKSIAQPTRDVMIPTINSFMCTWD
jgi:hypothetical protein